MILQQMKGSPSYRIFQSFWVALDWIYPPFCAGCRKPGSRWCFDCQGKTRLIQPPYCSCCGKVRLETGLCNTCRSQPPSFKEMRSWAVYEGPLREAVRRLKYKKELSLGDTFSQAMVALFTQSRWQVDAITPVPIGIARKSQRGYNQASLLARPMALRAGIEYLPKALKKVKDTPSQVGLNIHQRRANVKGSFQAQPGYVVGKKIMIVDDVCTSGATVEECSKVLLEAGAVEVYVITLARALFDPRDRSS